MGCCQGEKEESMVKVAPASDDSSSAQLHPLLNYIPGQDPELHPWAGGYIRWRPAQESSVPGSPEYFQEEPSVELGSVSEPLLSSEYSDKKDQDQR